MDYVQVVKSRVSVRNYDPEKKVPKEVLKRILEAGRLAPSAANRQPWHFLVVTSQEILAQVKQSYSAPWFQDAPAVLAVTGKRSDAWTRKHDGYNSLETDLTIAMDHMILCADTEGVGTCWIAAFDPKILGSALSLGAEEVVFAVTPLGYPREGYEKPKEKSRKALEELVTFL